MTNQQKAAHIRGITMSPWSAIADALLQSEGDIDKAIKILTELKQADANDMANRVANAGIVYSYVHNNRVGAMIVLSCQTDFVTKNELFINLAKDICMHICSTPITPTIISKDELSGTEKSILISNFKKEAGNKPVNIIDKIVDGKLGKWYGDCCLLNQKFVKNDKITINQLIQDASGTLGEKIELKQFIKMKNDVGYVKTKEDYDREKDDQIRAEYTFSKKIEVPLPDAFLPP